MKRLNPGSAACWLKRNNVCFGKLKQTVLHWTGKITSTEAYGRWPFSTGL